MKVLDHPVVAGLILAQRKGASFWVFLVAQTVENLSAMQDTWSREDPLEKGMATHSSILAWRIRWTEDTFAFHTELCE